MPVTHKPSATIVEKRMMAAAAMRASESGFSIDRRSRASVGRNGSGGVNGPNVRTGLRTGKLTSPRGGPKSRTVILTRRCRMLRALARRGFLGVTGAAAVSSANGLRAVTRAMELMQQGTDTLDAAVEGVKIQELDPSDNSVGYGGLPNEDGVVQLDASCMHGPTRRAGAVGALEGIKTPSEVARLVLLYTNHILLVGEGAKRFALSYGFKEEDLLTPESRRAWLEWRAHRSSNDDWLDVPPNTPMGT